MDGDGGWSSRRERSRRTTRGRGRKIQREGKTKGGREEVNEPKLKGGNC